MISDINELANEVDHIVTSNPSAKDVFIRQIDKLCKMVEDYAQAQEPYTKELEKAKKQIEKVKNPTQFNRPLTDICPPPNGYVETSQQANRFVNVPPYNIYRPIEPVNPLLWFECFGDVNKQRKPTEDEKLMCDYVLLAIVHDYTQRISRTAMDFCFWFKDDEEKWADDVEKWFKDEGRLFNKAGFYNKIGGYYAANHQNGLVRALERIKADIAAAPESEPTIITLKRSEDFGKRETKTMKLAEDLEGKRPGEAVTINEDRHPKDPAKTLMRSCPKLKGKIHTKGKTIYSDIIIKLEA